jgi:hypothetical protein
MVIKQPHPLGIAFFAVLTLMIALPNRAWGQSMPSQSAVVDTAGPQSSDRYGLFQLLDHRSVYGQGAFPEPFLVDDSDLEVNELRVDWLHTERHGTVSDTVTGEVEKGFGVLTLEIEVPWEKQTARDFDPSGNSQRSTAEGMGNIDLGARIPIYQFVSADGLFDNTVGTAIEVGVPTNSIVSKNAEFVPKIFDDLCIANHFTVQAILGYSMLFGSGDDGGVNTFEYGFVFGYGIDHHMLPIPAVRTFVPMLELSGETQLNHADAGHNSLIGNAGFRVDMNAIGPFQPRLGIGYVFPVDQGARQDIHWGIVTSLVFEY